MSNSLSLGWTRSVAARRLSSHQRVFGLALILQLIIGAIFLFCPSYALSFVGLDTAMGPEWPSIWGATLIFVTTMQLPGVLNPVRQRYPNVIAILGRILMVLTFASHGGPFLWFAAFDAIFALLLALGFRHVVITELMTRP